MGSRPIPEQFYRQIHEKMPIACIDIVIVREQQVLLLRRLREPAKGQLWFPGGALHRNEEFEDAVRRLAHEEAGLAVEDVKFLGIDNLTFEQDPFGHGKGSHMVGILFCCRPPNGAAVTLDQDHSGHVWSDGSDEELHPSVKRFILLAQHR